MPSQIDKEIAQFLVIVSKNVRKHGYKKVVKHIQSIDYQENSIHYDEIIAYIFKIVCEEFCITKDNLINKNMRGVVTVARKIAMVISKKHLGVSDDNLAFQFKRVRQSVFAAYKEFESLDRENKFDKRYFEKYDTLNDKVVKFIKELKGEVD